MFTQPRAIGLHVGLLGAILIAVVVNPVESVPLLGSNWIVGGYSLMVSGMSVFLAIGVAASLSGHGSGAIPPFLSPAWSAFMIESGYILAMLFVVLPQVLWGGSIVSGLLMVTSVLSGWADFLMSALVAVIFLVGSFFLGGGIWAYPRITRSRDDMLHSKVIWLMKDFDEFTIEDAGDMAEALVVFETIGDHTIEYWSDITYFDDEWKWEIPPEAIRDCVTDPLFTMPRLILPLSVESHRRWRIIGVALIGAGAVIHTLHGSEQYLPILEILLTIFVSYVTMQFAFGSD
ncbi:hypothetical protein [Halohasta litorea]|nr:hypothetical protein [Halohasta litorea]